MANESCVLPNPHGVKYVEESKKLAGEQNWSQKMVGFP